MLASASVDGTAVLWNLHSTRKLYTMVQVNGDAIRVCRSLKHKQNNSIVECKFSLKICPG